jgi:autotransporter-associated beta strand protein
MSRLRPAWCAVVLILLLLAPAAAFGQNRLTWNFSYVDVNTGSGFGFDDPNSGQLRRETVTAVGNYLANNIIDARGGINFVWNQSLNSSSGLASAGATYAWSGNVSLLVGSPYRQGSGNITTSANTGSGQVNFGRNWFATGLSGTGTPASNQFDLYSVILHELTHAMHFASAFSSTGASQLNAGVYTRHDGFVYRGATGDNKLLNEAGTTFIGSSTDLTSNDLFWGGEFAVAANGGNRVKLYAPSSFSTGSSISHVDQNTYPNLVMSPLIAAGAVRREYSGIEIGMLLDLGWNNFDWDNTTGNWSAGSSNIASTKWQNSAISNSTDKRILAPVGEVTHNMVLTFGGSGSSSYTSTNDLNPTGGAFKLNRLRLNSTSSATNTIAGNPLSMSNDNGFNVTPMIEQRNTGAFVINNTIDIPKGLIVGGTGSGQVTLGGVVSGAGGLTKQGSYTLILTGNNTYSGGTTISGGTLQVGTGGGTGAITGNVTNNATLVVNRSGTLTLPGNVSGSGNLIKNGTGSLTLTGNNTYSGSTAVNAGTLIVSGQTGNNSGTGSGAVTVASAAILGGDGRIGNGTSGSLTVLSGATVRPGDGASVGTLTLNSNQNAAFAGGSTLEIAVGSSPTVGSQFRTLGGANIDLTGLLPTNRLSIVLFSVDLVQAVQYTLAVLNAEGSGSILYPTGGFSPDLFQVSANGFDITGSFVLSGTADSLFVTFTPVPEPGTVLAVGVAGLGLIGLARRLRRRANADATLAA